MARTPKLILAIVAAASLTLAGTAGATVNFVGSAGPLAASASFTVVGNQLTIVLTNTSVADVMIPAEILTALFFDHAPSVTLSPVSATLTGGSTVFFGPNGGGNVGGEYAYGDGLVGAPGGAGLGTSSSGFGLFGAPNFGGASLDPPNAVDGLNYGITSAGDNLATGNAAVTGGFPLIKNQVTFVLNAVGGGPLSESGFSNVSFQYGTGLDEPNVPSVPEPTTLLALGTGLVALGAARRRSRKN